MNLYRRFVRWLFFIPEKTPSKWQIIVWWELRRIPYNLIVGLAAVCSLFLLYLFTAHEPIDNGQDIVEPIMVLIAPFILNLCYTGGWIVEAFFPKTFLESFMVERKQLGAKFLRWGLQFSLGVVFLPTVVWGIFWILRLMGLRK